MDVKYPHLKLRDWPFQVVPDERFQRIWADRREVLEDINLVLESLSRRDNSTINLLWAWYGAGKSHTLRHLEYLCRNRFPQILPVYIELPRKIYSFLDLYVSFVEAIGRDAIKEMAREVLIEKKDTGSVKKIASIYEEFLLALELLVSDDPADESLAWRWLAVKNVRLAEFRSRRVSRKIDNSDWAVKAMAALSVLIQASTRYSRVLWMIDEFQRVAKSSSEVFLDVSVGLHSVFNAAPACFSILLSFLAHSEEEMFSLLSKELLDRIGISKVIRIPKMDEREALTFLSDLLYEFRPSIEELPGEYFPFSEEAVKYILFLISQKSELKPRSIMQYFNAVLERAEPLIEMNEIKEIDVDFVRRILSEEQVIYFAAESVTA